MADDVYANAIHRQTAPNINTNDKMESQRLVEINDAKMMDKDNSNTKNLLQINSYGKTSTDNDVENPSAATATKNNNNKLNECPPTPSTSNTTNNKASLLSYLEKTTTNTSSDDMVIDVTTTPNQPPDRSSSTKRFFSRKTPPSQQQELPSPNVPPIRPFTLGQTINMSSLSSAVRAVQSEKNKVRTTTETADHLDTKSVSSMDTSDVSKILKPKSIFNPYAKQHRNKTQDLDITETTTTGMDENNVDIYAQINNTNNLVYDRAPLIPHMNNSINSNDPTLLTTKDHI
jgi:hypothetical protein